MVMGLTYLMRMLDRARVIQVLPLLLAEVMLNSASKPGYKNLKLKLVIILTSNSPDTEHPVAFSP